LFGSLAIDAAERLLIAVLGSITIAIGVALALDLTARGIDPTTAMFSLGAVTVVCSAVALARLPRTAPAGSSPTGVASVAVGVAAAVALVVLLVHRAEEPVAPSPAVTGYAVLAIEPRPGSVRIRVESDELRKISF